MTDKCLECPVFRPTLDEVRNLSFTEPIRQHATGRQGLYRTLLVEQRSQNLASFKAMAEDTTNGPPSKDPETLERKFWKNVPMNPPLYGADIPGSLFDDRLRGWNLKRLNSLLSSTLESSGASIPGVTQPYLYVGSWRSFFAWHTEDLDLHSVNFLHSGAPKTWYVVPPAARDRFEQTTKDLLPELSRSCPEFLRHKEILLSPALLAAHNIPLVKAVHNAREFVVVGPGAYHAGFNHGYNIAESVNFATKSWVAVGARASFCTCRPDSVKIDMRLFVDYMDEPLAKEVMDSYRSESEEESEEESESESESESDSEDSESSSSSESESESEEEEEEVELPAKRVRRPSAKAAANGVNALPHTPPTPVVSAAKPAPAAALRRLNKDTRSGHKKTAAVKVTPPTRRASPLEKEQKQALVKRALDRKKRLSVPTARTTGRNSKAVPAAVAAAVHASSSDDDSSGGNLRSVSKRGAAQAWYRLFDSLLPSLKRARA